MTFYDTTKLENKTIDLKDCFYTIPLQESDTTCFVFTVPSINNKKPVS